MKLTLQQAADIVSLTENELMYQNQIGNIQAGVNQDTMAWEFDLDSVLKLKSKLDSEAAETEETEDDS